MNSHKRLSTDCPPVKNQVFLSKMKTTMAPITRNDVFMTQLCSDTHLKAVIKNCLKRNSIHSKECEAEMLRETRRAQMSRAMMVTNLLTLRAPEQQCEVRKSQTHGRGVFATRPIPKGDVVTFYPADAILVFPPAKYTSSIKQPFAAVVCFEPGTERFAKQYKMDVQKQTYSACGVAVIGNPNSPMTTKSEGHVVGHMVNDAACLRGPLSHTSSAVQSYCVAVATRANADFKDECGMVVAICAERDIGTGEEILVSYGPEYWMKQ